MIGKKAHLAQCEQVTLIGLETRNTAHSKTCLKITFSMDSKSTGTPNRSMSLMEHIAVFTFSCDKVNFNASNMLYTGNQKKIKRMT